MMAPGARHTKPSKDEFAFANDPLSNEPGSWFRHIVPFHIFNTAAAIAYEVMMPRASSLESSRTALDSHFTH
jgi:hypothetical protein